MSSPRLQKSAGLKHIENDMERVNQTAKLVYILRSLRPDCFLGPFSCWQKWGKNSISASLPIQSVSIITRVQFSILCNLRLISNSFLEMGNYLKNTYVAFFAFNFTFKYFHKEERKGTFDKTLGWRTVHLAQSSIRLLGLKWIVLQIWYLSAVI